MLCPTLAIFRETLCLGSAYASTKEEDQLLQLFGEFKNFILVQNGYLEQLVRF